MSRFRKLSHTIWHCQYHIVWVPKYRFRMLTGAVGNEVERCIRSFSEQQQAEIVELNIGHAIVARAVFDGFPAAVGEMKKRMREAREG